MVDAKQIFKEPLDDQEWHVKTVIGGICFLLVVTIPFGVGFLAETALRGAQERWGLPFWENWGEKFVRGLVIIIISLIYWAIPIIITAAGSIPAFNTPISPDLPVQIIFVKIIPYLLISLLLLLVIGFVMPMSLINYIVTDSIKAAFDMKKIIELIKAVYTDYIYVYAIMVIVIVVISSVMWFMPLVVKGLMTFVNVYISAGFCRQFGLLYARAVRKINNV